jgi:predicted Zn-dependent protease
MLTTQDTNPNAQKPFLLWRPIVYSWQWLVPPSQADVDRRSNASRYVAAAIIVGLCAVLVSLALVFGRPLHHTIKTWRSDREVKKSLKFEAGDKAWEAMMAANEAVKLDGDNPRALRQLARFATIVNDRAASGLWGKLDKLGAMNDEDVEWRIKALSKNNEAKAAQSEIEEVLKKRRPTESIVRTADTVMKQLGRTGELLNLLQTYAEQTPDDIGIRSLLGMRLVEFGQPKQVQEGIKLLWEVSADEKESGLKAIEFLYRLKLEGEGDQLRLIERLEHHPLVKEDHRIAALRRLAELHPERKAELMNKALAERGDKKREDLPPVLRWFVDEHEFVKLLAFLKPREEMVQDYTPLLENYLNALTFTKQYDELDRIVNDPKTRLTTAERATHRMHLGYITKKDNETMSKLLLEALDANQAAHKLDVILLVASYAETRGLNEEALKAFKVATGIPKIEREGYDGTLRIAYLLGDSKTYFETSRETVRRWPENQTYQERHLYSCLLSGQDLEVAVKGAQKLLDARPNDSVRKLLMALAYYRLMQPNESFTRLQNINLPDLSVGQGAVLCGILRALNGKSNAQATQIAKQIPQNYVMLPEEARFLQMVSQ